PDPPPGVRRHRRRARDVPGRPPALRAARHLARRRGGRRLRPSSDGGRGDARSRPPELPARAHPCDLPAAPLLADGRPGGGLRPLAPGRRSRPGHRRLRLARAAGGRGLGRDGGPGSPPERPSQRRLLPELALGAGSPRRRGRGRRRRPDARRGRRLQARPRAGRGCAGRRARARTSRPGGRAMTGEHGIGGAGGIGTGGGTVVPFRRPQGQPRRKRRSLWVRLMRPLVTALGIVGLPIACGLWVATAPQFALREIAIDGAGHASEAWIRGTLEPLSGRNLPLLPLAEAAERLRRHPWVDSVELSKELPGRLRVRVVEKRPAVFLRRDGRLYWADTAGRAIAPGELRGTLAAGRRARARSRGRARPGESELGGVARRDRGVGRRGFPLADGSAAVPGAGAKRRRDSESAPAGGAVATARRALSRARRRGPPLLPPDRLAT